MTSLPDRTPALLRDVSIYNPDQLRKDELIAYFIARRPLLERILEDLRLGGSAQHHLLIGTRGMGKTTLLKRILFAIEDDAVLSREWLPLTFPEEQYNVTHLSDLYLNCIDALSDTLEQRGQQQKARELDAEVAALSGKNEDERSGRALSILLDTAGGMKKRLLLLLDNIDILFDRLKAQAWALRELLSRENTLVLVGASASHPEETYTYEAPFYDFFKVHELRGLPEEEARQLILHLSDLRGAVHVRRMVESEPARLRTLHTLSGGNPRTLVLLYFVLVQSVEGDARTDLERMLDHITPLYKARIEALAAQAQKLFDAVAVHWHPVTAVEIAARTHLEVGVVSSQVSRLVREGVLERVATPEGTKSAYQVAERLLNVWYLMRQSRRVRQRLVWLVEFLCIFYGSQELLLHARVHLGRGVPAEEGERLQDVEYRLALAQAVEDGSLRYALESTAVRAIVEYPSLRERIKSIVDLEGADASLQPLVDKHRAAIELRERIHAAKVTKDGWNAAEFAELLGGSFSLNRREKQQIVDVLDKLRPAQIDALELSFRKEVEAFEKTLGTDVVRSLRRAFQEGYMDTLSDLDGAYGAALTLNVPDLPIESIIYAVAERLKEVAPARRAGINQRGRPLWVYLGNLLQYYLDRCDKAEEAYRKATEILPMEGDGWRHFAWCRFLADKIDDQTEQAVRTAAKLKPDSLHIAHTLACILVRRGKWDEPAELIAKIIERADPEFLEETWVDIVRFFAECVRAGRTAAAIELLDKIGFGQRWLPLRAALEATIEGRASLLRIAPELRLPAAEKIYDDLVALSGAVEPPAQSPKATAKPRRK